MRQPSYLGKVVGCRREVAIVLAGVHRFLLQGDGGTLGLTRGKRGDIFEKVVKKEV